MTIAIVAGTPFGRDAASALRRWLRESGIEPDSCARLTLIRPDDYQNEDGKRREPKESEIKAAVAKTLNDLAAIHGLTAVVAVGRYGVRLDTDLWRGGILKAHGHSGSLTLQDGRKVNAIALYDPYLYVKHAKDGNTRRATELDASCRLVLSRIKHMDDPIVLPSVTVRDRVLVSGLVGFDVETTDDKELHRLISKATVEPRSSRLKMVGLSTGELSFSGADFAADAEPVAYNLPFDAITSGNWSARWHDPKMLAHLMGEKDTEMKSLALRTLGRPLMHYDEAGGTENEPAYCVADATAHRDLLLALRERAPAGVLNVYDYIERPMFRLYSRWSMEGVFWLDRDRAQALYDRKLDELETLRIDIEHKTGIRNPHAREQVASAIFGWRKGIDGPCPTVDEATLAENRHKPGVNEILDYRDRAKVANTYLGAWLKWPFEKLGSLWRPTGAWTGRPSVAALQLQNVPEWLRGLLLSPPGKRLKAYDNSQLELRIAAHISQDPEMIRTYLAGEDLHDVACRELGVTDRRFGKIFNFSQLYGGSDGAVISQAAKYGVSPDEIRPLIKPGRERLQKRYRGFWTWTERVKSLSRVPGLFGAILVPPDHPNELHMERERINAPIQRGAVDVVKLQALALERAGFKTVHMVHDEIIIELDEADDTLDTDHTIRETMQNAVRLDVPLLVEKHDWGAE